MLKLRCLALAGAMSLFGVAAQAATIVRTFDPVISTADGSGTVAVTLAGLDPNIDGDLTIDFTFFGDLNTSDEYFELFLDGTSFGIGCDNSAANGDFGFATGPLSDTCAQSANSLTDTSLLVGAVEALGLLADGALEIAFAFSSSVTAFTDINNGGETRSGVFFADVLNASFGAGGTVTYETTEAIAPVPLPPSLLLLAGGLVALRGRYSAA